MAAIPPNPGGAGGGAGAPPPNPSNVGRIGRALAGIASFLGQRLAAVSEGELRARWDGLKSLLWSSILVPVVLFTIGMFVGRLGVYFEAPLMQTAATTLFALGSLLGALGVTYLWTKIMVYTQGAVLLSESARALSDAFPLIPRTRVDTFLIWLRGWTAWFIGALLILTYVPVYRSVILAMTLLAALLLMAAIMSACWNNSPWPRRILTIFAVCAIAGSIFQLTVPGTCRSIRDWTASLVDGITSWGDRHNRVVEVERAATEREAVQDAQRLDLIRARQAEIRQRVLDDNCSGAFCSPEDRDEYRRLQREADRLLEGTMREDEPAAASANAPAAANGLSVSPSASPPAVRTKAPPAPSPERRHRVRRSAAHPSSGVRERGSSGLPRVTYDELDDIFFPIHSGE
jgi:hypothetical protein